MDSVMRIEPVVTRAAWRGRDMQDSDEWIYRLNAEEIAEIDAALAHLKTTGQQIPEIGKEHFPLERFARTLRLLQTEIENGLGIMLVRGLPRDRYSAEEMGLIYWGIGAHFGRAVAQNAQGDVLGHVRDMGRDQYRDMHARGYQTASRLPFHNDSCDIVGLCCLETARSGGLSAVASSVAVYNELAAIAARPRPGAERSRSMPTAAARNCPARSPTTSRRPSSGTTAGCSTATTAPSSTRRSASTRCRGSPTCRSRRSIWSIACATTATFRLDMKLERGDMQFVNNYVVLHSRTAYEDHPRRRASATCCGCGCARRPSPTIPPRCATATRTWTSGAPARGRRPITSST